MDSDATRHQEGWGRRSLRKGAVQRVVSETLRDSEPVIV
jgi:hypothetical protein